MGPKKVQTLARPVPLGFETQNYPLRFSALPARPVEAVVLPLQLFQVGVGGSLKATEGVA